METYKEVIIRYLERSKDAEETMTKMASASIIGREAVRAFREENHLEAIAWSRDAAHDALDVVGRE